MKLSSYTKAVLVLVLYLTETLANTVVTSQYTMCDNQTFDRVRLVGRSIYLVTPNYPYFHPVNTPNKSKLVQCGCKIKLERYEVTTVLRFQVESLHMANPSPGDCTSEYIAFSNTDNLAYIILNDIRDLRLCQLKNILYKVDKELFLAYMFNPTYVSRRDVGARLKITAEDAVGHLSLRCYDMMLNKYLEDNASQNSSNPTEEKLKRKPQQFQLLFVFGLVTLGVFIVVLLVVIIYLAMHCCRRRFGSLDHASEEIRIRRAIGGPMYVHHADPMELFTGLHNQPQTPILGLHAPVGPPDYAEEPPKYEALYDEDGILRETEENAPNPQTNNPTNITTNTPTNMTNFFRQTDAEHMTLQEFLREQSHWFRLHPHGPTGSGLTSLLHPTRNSSESQPQGNQPTENVCHADNNLINLISGTSLSWMPETVRSVAVSSNCSPTLASASSVQRANLYGGNIRISTNNGESVSWGITDDLQENNLQTIPTVEDDRQSERLPNVYVLNNANTITPAINATIPPFSSTCEMEAVNVTGQSSQQPTQATTENLNSVANNQNSSPANNNSNPATTQNNMNGSNQHVDRPGNLKLAESTNANASSSTSGSTSDVTRFLPDQIISDIDNILNILNGPFCNLSDSDISDESHSFPIV